MCNDTYMNLGKYWDNVETVVATQDIGIFQAAGLHITIELINFLAETHRSASVFCGIGECTLEKIVYVEMKGFGVSNEQNAAEPKVAQSLWYPRQREKGV